MSGDPAPIVVALHGFTRRPVDLQKLADACAGRGLATLRPGLGSFWWPSSMNNAGYLSRLALHYSDRLGNRPCVVVGHSAGTAAGSWLGAELRRRGVDVRGFVYVDGNESPTRLLARAWPAICDLPVRAVCAPPSRCNRQGQLASWLEGQSGDIVIDVIEGSGHGDIEGDTAPVYRWACGNDSAQDVRTLVMDQTLAYVEEVVGR